MMIGSSSSLMMRWASGLIRERLAMGTSAFLSAPIFNGSFHHLYQPQITSSTLPCSVGVSLSFPESGNREQEHIWFAVPKSKISRSRKRMKTTRQKRLPLKKNIVFDPRTGEVTLKHKMPFNWKDYLPKVE
mmetsp:Transcript_18323/g.42209  ORF Transcript_18323/g.42209 Transcript_18323/m.42209 type:complete len:131 (-) Transcript_18323:440-832(-)